MNRDDEDTRKTTGTPPPPLRPADETPPWWAEGADEDVPLPAGYPERPDIRKVHRLRESMTRERARREAADRNRTQAKLEEKLGRQVRDAGGYLLIPFMMLAGPAVGYGLGWFLQNRFGGEPWLLAGGVLFGVAAGFHQTFLLLKKKNR
jgi:F0F1-type ATP synthase assembly protein I